MDIAEIGSLFKKRREFLSLKQEDLAEMSGITTRTINIVETGVGNPSLKTLEKLALVLGLEILVQIKKANE
ncbi:MAG: helix-turn-helix domain-containing protein [Chitinophagaceae bacterium]|nr:helix-turn-helix domain-containing protein [Chitinophagaceae bacterium]